jgi:hypothetical protein
VALEGGLATMTERYPEVGILDKWDIFKPLRKLQLSIENVQLEILVKRMGRSLKLRGPRKRSRKLSY